MFHTVYFADSITLILKISLRNRQAEVLLLSVIESFQPSNNFIRTQVLTKHKFRHISFISNYLDYGWVIIKDVAPY